MVLCFGGETRHCREEGVRHAAEPNYGMSKHRVRVQKSSGCSWVSVRRGSGPLSPVQAPTHTGALQTRGVIFLSTTPGIDDVNLYYGVRKGRKAVGRLHTVPSFVGHAIGGMKNWIEEEHGIKVCGTISAFRVPVGYDTFLFLFYSGFVLLCVALFCFVLHILPSSLISQHSYAPWSVFLK